MIELIDKPDYKLLTAQIRSLGEEEDYHIPVMANAASILYHALPDINWAGFYIVRDGALILGPFNGKPACIRIEKGSGVCGTSWSEDEVERVENVHEFPGHIACDSASNSEIVLPIHGEAEGEHFVKAVLDIDSPSLNRFSAEDEAGLREFVNALEDIMRW